MKRMYPRLVIDLDKLRNNFTQIVDRCGAQGISVAGVVKGVNGLNELAALYHDCGAKQLASSRLEQLEQWHEAGIPGPFLLLRIPGMSELEELPRLADYSLQSDRTTLDALETVCARQEMNHKVIIMADLGDLREGFWDKDEMVEVCCHVEHDLPHLTLAGVGVNLGCYGSIQATPEKMNDLIAIARQVESRIGRKLELISGGATSSYSLVHQHKMPAGINHLRIGEGVLLAKDLQVDWGIHDMTYLQRGTIFLQAEIAEIRSKPTYPVGELSIDAFGHRRTYVDRGVRRRAIAVFGRADVGEVETLLCREEGMSVIGGASDHCILDVEDCKRPLQVGDIVEFDFCYSHMLYAASRDDLPIFYLHA